MTTVTMGVGDREPVLTTVATWDDGSPVDLTGGSATFTLLRLDGTAVFTARPAVIDDPTEGELSYAWQAGDLAVAGRYRARFTVTIAGKALTVPSHGAIEVVVS